MMCEQDFCDFFATIAQDIMLCKGMISSCERFPPFVDCYLTKDHRLYSVFVMRAKRMKGLSYDWVDKRKGSSENHELEHHKLSEIEAAERKAHLAHPDRLLWHKPLRGMNSLTAGECILAIDLDYGDVPFDEKEILADIRIFQEVMVDRGAPIESTRCVVAVATDNGKLGVHIYFICSRYFPEECMWLVWLALIRFKRERKRRGSRPWKKIIDLAIYNGSLRLMGLQKSEDCPLCNPSEDKPQQEHIQRCKNLEKAFSKFKRDQRAIPFVSTQIELESGGIVSAGTKKRTLASESKEFDIGSGEADDDDDDYDDNEIHMNEVTMRKTRRGKKMAFRIGKQGCPECDGRGTVYRGRRYMPRFYIDEKGQIDNSLIKDTANIKLPSEILARLQGEHKKYPNLGTDINFLQLTLIMCSIRVVFNCESHTPFFITKGTSRPEWAKTWVMFCDALLKNDTSISKLIGKPGTELVKQKPVLTEQQEKKERRELAKHKKLLEAGKYDDLTSKTDLTAEQLMIICGGNSEFKSRKNDVPEHLLLKMIQEAEYVIQKRTILAYRNLIVTDVTFSEEYGSAMVLVEGSGVCYCSIKPGQHSTAKIWFSVRKNHEGGLYLTQYCMNPICKEKQKSHPVQYDIARDAHTQKFYCCFAPRTALQHRRKELTSDQVELAQQLCKTVVSKPPPKSRRRGGSTKVKKVTKRTAAIDQETIINVIDSSQTEEEDSDFCFFDPKKAPLPSVNLGFHNTVINPPANVKPPTSLPWKDILYRTRAELVASLPPGARLYPNYGKGTGSNPTFPVSKKRKRCLADYRYAGDARFTPCLTPVRIVPIVPKYSLDDLTSRPPLPPPSEPFPSPHKRPRVSFSH